jgi:hypothetical protein
MANKNLPKKIVETLINLEKKIVKYPLDDKIKKMRDKFIDEKENRELVVVDKYGNKYYQYYSNHGVPSRRFVNLNMIAHNKWHDDIFMKAWLEKRRDVPPTQEELEKMYIQLEEFQRKGLEWDRNEAKLMEEFRKKQKEAIEKERKETGAIGDGKNYAPGIWDKTQTKKMIEKNNTQLVEVKENSTELVEGASTIPGKYHMELYDQAINYYKNEYEKSLEPYRQMELRVDWSNYTLEKMVEKYHQDRKIKRSEMKEKAQQLTNLGKKMLEQKEKFQGYSEFRQRFQDVFEEFDFK